MFDFESVLLAASVDDFIELSVSVVARLAFAELDAVSVLLFIAEAFRLAVRLLVSVEFDAAVPDESVVPLVAAPVPLVAR